MSHTHRIRNSLAAGLAGLTFAAGMAGVLAGPAGATTTTTTTAACPTGTWPSTDEGRPTQAERGMTGVALWHDHLGWHLRASEAGPDRAVFTGHISTDGAIGGLARHLEGGDVVATRGAHDIWFRFTNYGGVDGIDFSLACASGFRLNVAMNGAPLPLAKIVIGPSNAHPASLPFSIHKV
jgi:hypothetical protein